MEYGMSAYPSNDYPYIQYKEWGLEPLSWSYDRYTHEHTASYWGHKSDRNLRYRIHREPSKQYGQKWEWVAEVQDLNIEPWVWRPVMYIHHHWQKQMEVRTKLLRDAKYLCTDDAQTTVTEGEIDHTGHQVIQGEIEQ
jgi:hypothetical protein